MIDSFLQDVRLAWRGLRRTPAFAAVAVATLALGIGANSAIFTVVNAVVVRPLPYAHPDRLVRVTSDFTALHASDMGLSQPELIDYRDRSGLFESIAGVWAINANLTQVDQPERVEVLLASPSYFDVLGVRPQLGRLFGPQDAGPGITEVAVLSDAVWRRRFGGLPDAIGRKLRIDDDWYTVVGVLPPGFRHPGRSVLTDVDIWCPASYVGNPFPAQPVRGAYFITGAIGRLKAGVSVEQAQQRLAGFARDLRQSYPNDYPARAAWAPRIVGLQADLVGSVRPVLLILFGAVGVVLLIACANIANLLLARASTRQRELAVRRARTLPGVTAAAAVGFLPFDGTRSNAAIVPDGGEGDDRSRIARTQTTVASSGYFELMGMRLLAGRTFTDQDDQKAQPVVVVTEALARNTWPGQNAVGRRVRFNGPPERNPWMTVVGVVNDVRNERPEEPSRPTMYRPLRQASNLILALVLKTAADPDTLAAPLAAEVRAVDPDQPTYGVRTMGDIVHDATASRRFSAQLLGAFAVLALVLAAVGIYGVMAFVVGQRTREMGIRIALGAHPGAVVRLMLREAMGLVAAGVTLGALAALGATRLLGNLLFEVRHSDPATYTLIAMLLAATAAVAAWQPARRAASVDPISALRTD